MMRKIISFLFLFCSAFALHAEKKVKGVVKDGAGITLAGANVFWAESRTGTVTDADGTFTLPLLDGSDRLVVSYIGFSPDTVTVRNPRKEISVVLTENVQLQEVVIVNRRPGTIHSRISPLQTQQISADELCRAACCNLAESFETNPSVDVSYSDAATGARQIRLLGLSGTYVQMLTEQVPNLRGAASLYGLGYIPGPWMESIQVSKGTSSVKNGYEALTGQINVEYKKPQTADPLSVNLFLADNMRMEVNVDGNIALGKKWSTGLFFNYANEMRQHDGNKDGFMDLPQTEQLNLLNRWYYKSDRYVSQILLNVLGESRQSGQTHHAPLLPEGRYRVHIDTKRGGFFTKNAYILDKEKNGSLALIFSGSYHEQQSLFGKKKYDVTQHNLYANLIYETEFTPVHRFSAGLSFNYDLYDERLSPGVLEQQAFYPERRTERVPGAYAQYTLNRNDRLVVLVGLRGDYHNEHGFFLTPRLHVKYDILPELIVRASAGKGFRTANELVENSYLLAGNRTIRIAPRLDRFEEAWNFGASLSANIPVANRNLSVNLEWYYTDFINQVVMDMDRDAHEVSFYNLDGRSYAQSAQIEASYPFFRGFTLTGAFRMTDVKSTYRGRLREKPLTNRYKALATASYQTPLKKWQFDLTASFNGPGRMPDATAANPLWKNEFGSYALLNAQITKYFRTWSVYIGGENLTGYTQKNPVIGASNPWGSDFDASMIYGPVHGAKFYIGVRWSLPRG